MCGVKKKKVVTSGKKMKKSKELNNILPVAN
jgi:hypothetical protein